MDVNRDRGRCQPWEMVRDHGLVVFCVVPYAASLYSLGRGFPMLEGEFREWSDEKFASKRAEVGRGD